MIFEGTGRDMYLRITPSSGRAWVAYHRVWDGDKFFDSSVRAHAEGKNPAVVQRIDRATYLKEKR